jgi:hypothetical protein
MSEIEQKKIGTNGNIESQSDSARSVASSYGVADRANKILDFPSQDTNPHVLAAYPEMAWLTGDVNATPEGIATVGQAASLSEQLFNKKHIEFDRTAVGMMVLKWIIKGDYEGFTACQGDAVKLSRHSFDELSEYTQRILPDAEAIDAMVTYMVINDLGKIQSVVAQVKSTLNVEDVDHDKILLSALEKNPEISPSFQRLSPRYKDLIVHGLKAEFNIGQFIQGENVAASLRGLAGLNEASLDFYLLHAVCDIAGAAGHVKQNGAMVMTEPTYQGFKMSIDAINRMSDGATPKDVYDYYLSRRAETLNLDITDPKQKALVRICCMLRVSDAARAEDVTTVFGLLPSNTQIILTQELNRSGVDDGYATLLYYSPATLANAQAAYSKAGDPDAFSKGLSEGLTALARAYQEAAIAIKSRQGNGVYTVIVSALAEAAKTPGELNQLEMSLRQVGDDAELNVQKKK